MEWLLEVLSLIAAVLGIVAGILGVIQSLTNRRKNFKAEDEPTVAPSDISSAEKREISEVETETREEHSRQH